MDPMCYSAQLHEAYAKYVRAWGAEIDFPTFVRLYGQRHVDRRIRIPRAVDRLFDQPATDDERSIKALIDAFDADETTRLEAELFNQKTRLNKAVRALETRATKKAAEDRRIATNKIESAAEKLSALRRKEVAPRDRRFFPGWHVPVLVAVGATLRLVPMRYQCRPAGKPAFHDTKYPGTYNARRDSLDGYWKGVFGVSHGLVIADTFYENVEGPDGRNRVLQFTPRTREPLLIACLWSHWVDPKGVEPDLLSFAAITDEPEPEVAAAGHDRTIINIKPTHLEAWLHPQPGDLGAMQSIFDDRQHPYYEHSIAA
jgi:putative SOS response-associated peptidase YedK